MDSMGKRKREETENLKLGGNGSEGMGEELK